MDRIGRPVATSSKRVRAGEVGCQAFLVNGSPYVESLSLLVANCLPLLVLPNKIPHKKPGNAWLVSLERVQILI